MKTALKTLLLLSLVILGACSSKYKDIEIDAQADPKVSLDGYQSYAWLASSEIVYDPESQWEPKDLDIDAEVRFVINDNLRKRDMIEVTENPDMLVVFAAGVDMMALGLKENPDTKEEMLTNVPEAGLVVGFIDPDTGFLIWRGVASAKVAADRDLQETRKRIEYSIRKMFKKIP